MNPWHGLASSLAPVYVTAAALLSRVDASSTASPPVGLGAGFTVKAMRVARMVGADGFEIQRALLPAHLDAALLDGLRQEGTRFPARPCLAVSRPLLAADHTLDEPGLVQALDDARRTGCALLQLPLTGAATFPRSARVWERSLRRLRERLNPWIQPAATRLIFAVENRPARGGGNLARWVELFTTAERLGVPLFLACDLGGLEDWPLRTDEVLRALGRWIISLRCRRLVRRGAHHWESLPVERAGEMLGALAWVPPGTPRVLDFPVRPESLAGYLATLRSGRFTVRGGTGACLVAPAAARRTVRRTGDTTFPRSEPNLSSF